MTELPSALAAAQARFDRGDFQGARRALQALLASSPPPNDDDAAAARALLARMAPDPWAARFGVLVLAVLALVIGLYVR
jgi:hypothetical protein